MLRMISQYKSLTDLFTYIVALKNTADDYYLKFNVEKKTKNEIIQKDEFNIAM